MPRRSAENFGKRPAVHVLNPASGQAKGLVGWWPIGHLGVKDAGPYRRYHGIQAAQIEIRADPIMGKVVFNPGAADSTGITVQNTADLVLIPGTYNFAFTCWASTLSISATRNIIGGFDGTDDLLLRPFGTANGPEVFWRDLGGTIIDLNGGIPAADGNFHHFCFVSYASNDHRMFVDGLQVANSTATGSVGPFSNFRMMSYEVTQNTFNGNACDFRLYGIAPTPSMIMAMFEPDTRWDLYAQVPRRLAAKASAVAAGGRFDYLTLLGVS